MDFAVDALNSFIESQIFFPDTVLEYTPEHVGLEFENLWLTTSDGVRIHGWLIPARSSQAVFLFCHGNAGNISHRLDNLVRLHALGITVLIFDYRGYGNSEGRITEKGFYLDAEAAVDKAGDLARKMGCKLVVFGRSLGGIAAVHIAANRSCSGLILESTFPNLAFMARVHFPLPFIHLGLKDKFNAIGEIGKVKCPKLFFHGDRDAIVPIECGEALFEAATEPKEFVRLSGSGHNDTYFIGGATYFEKMSGFIDNLDSPPASTME